MCRDVHQGFHDLCCHAQFFPNSYTLLSIDAQLLGAEFCKTSQASIQKLMASSQQLIYGLTDTPL